MQHVALYECKLAEQYHMLKPNVQIKQIYVYIFIIRGEREREEKKNNKNIQYLRAVPLCHLLLSWWCPEPNYQYLHNRWHNSQEVGKPLAFSPQRIFFGLVNCKYHFDLQDFCCTTPTGVVYHIGVDKYLFPTRSVGVV